MTVFETATKHINLGGIFIFDLWYGPGVLTTHPTIGLNILKNEEANVLRIAQPHIHSDKNVVEVKYSVQVKKKKMSRK